MTDIKKTVAFLDDIQQVLSVPNFEKGNLPKYD